MAVAQRIYANALFEAAKERGRLERVRKELGDFVHALADIPELRNLLANPQLDSEAKASALEELLEGSDELVRNFLRLVTEKGRAGEIEEIFGEFEGLVAAEENVLSVELTTAVELSDAEARKIARQIEQASGHRVQASRSVDPDLIGGIVLEAGTHRVDASVRGRLNRLRRQLATRS